MAACEEEADLYFEDREKRRVTAELPEETLVHYDTPLTRLQQQTLLVDAGFTDVRLAIEEELAANHCILIAEKP